MNRYSLLYIVVLFFACAKQGEKEVLNLSPEEMQLLGVWQEFGPKIASVDSNGVVIDSIDINAIYEFHDDYSFESQNDIFTIAEEGEWAFDSSYTQLWINTEPNQLVFQSDHTWSISKFNDTLLMVTHQYKFTLPNEEYYVSYPRTFKKVE